MIFERVSQMLFVPDIDIFASRLNYLVDNYVSWKPDPGVFAIVAFFVNSQEFKPYFFPSFSLLGRSLLKTDLVPDAIIVTPSWPINWSGITHYFYRSGTIC